MPKRVKSDETASRTMSIMPTAAFTCPGDAPKKAKLSEGTFERSENPKVSAEAKPSLRSRSLEQ